MPSCLVVVFLVLRWFSSRFSVILLFEASLISMSCFVMNSGLATCEAALSLYRWQQALANAFQPLAEVNWQLVFAAGQPCSEEDDKNELYFADTLPVCLEFWTALCQVATSVKGLIYGLMLSLPLYYGSAWPPSDILSFNEHMTFHFGKHSTHDCSVRLCFHGRHSWSVSHFIFSADKDCQRKPGSNDLSLVLLHFCNCP